MHAIMSFVEHNFIFLFIIFAVIAIVYEFLFGEFHRNKTPFWAEKTPQKKQEIRTKDTSRKLEENRTEKTHLKWDKTSLSYIQMKETPSPLSQHESSKKELVFKRFLVKDFLAKLYTEGYATGFNHELIDDIQINTYEEKKLMAIIQDAYNTGYKKGYDKGYDKGYVQGRAMSKH